MTGTIPDRRKREENRTAVPGRSDVRKNGAAAGNAAAPDKQPIFTKHYHNDTIQEENDWCNELFRSRIVLTQAGFIGWSKQYEEDRVPVPRHRLHL